MLEIKFIHKIALPLRPGQPHLNFFVIKGIVNGSPIIPV